MRGKIRIAIASVIILVVISVFLFYSLRLGKPNHQLTKGFYVTLKGDVTTSNDRFDKENKPNDVKVYHSYYNLENLCTANYIKNANISWKGDRGNYIITFWSPVEEEVVITPNCNGCAHERVLVSKNENTKNVNLKWDFSSCVKQKERFENPELAFKRAIQLLDNADSLLAKKDFSESGREEVRNYISSGRDEIKDRTYYSNENESLFHASYAILYAKKAFYKLELLELENCVKKIKKVISNYTDDCYILPYEGVQNYISSNSTFTSFSEVLQYLDRRRYDEKEFDKVIRDTDTTIDNENNVRNAYWKCQEGLNLISNSLKHQEPYCKRQKLTLSFINLNLIGLALIIGYTIGKFGRRWDE